MAEIMKKVNVVTVGVGFTGGIVAAECTRAGLSVVGLDRGHYRTADDFRYVKDEWRYAINHGFMQDLSKETITFRNNRDQKALPMRKYGSFLMGGGLGGSGVHWSGSTFRFFPYDFEIKSKTDERYGTNKLSKDYLMQDWALTYDEIEPYYTTFEHAIGISGNSDSPFSGKRSAPYPLKSMEKTPVLKMFDNAAKNMGLHPYMLPVAVGSDFYTSPYGLELNQCGYSGFCERFGCEYKAKATPINMLIPAAEQTGNYDLRCNANVVEILKNGNKVTGVKYINTLTMEEFIQPADVVVLTGYALNNAKLLMISKIGRQYDPATGKGTLGRNYCYQVTPSVTGFFKDKMNLYAGSGGLVIGLDDYNSDNFDHSKLDFIHGGLISMRHQGKRPIASNPVPPGTPAWGAEYKKAINHYYLRALSVSTQGASIPHKENYLSLDDTYKDAYDLPLLRMTYNFTQQDRALFRYLSARQEEIMKEMGGQSIVSKPDSANYSIVPYQTTHNTGGTVAGKDPATSVVNSYLQHWDAENLFVVGGGNFAHNSGCNPTGTVGALGYRCSEGIIKYSKKQGSLV